MAYSNRVEIKLKVEDGCLNSKQINCKKHTTHIQLLWDDGLYTPVYDETYLENAHISQNIVYEILGNVLQAELVDPAHEFVHIEHQNWLMKENKKESSPFKFSSSNDTGGSLKRSFSHQDLKETQPMEESDNQKGNQAPVGYHNLKTANERMMTAGKPQKKFTFNLNECSNEDDDVLSNMDEPKRKFISEFLDPISSHLPFHQSLETEECAPISPVGYKQFIYMQQQQQSKQFNYVSYQPQQQQQQPQQPLNFCYGNSYVPITSPPPPPSNFNVFGPSFSEESQGKDINYNPKIHPYYVQIVYQQPQIQPSVIDLQNQNFPYKNMIIVPQSIEPNQMIGGLYYIAAAPGETYPESVGQPSTFINCQSQPIMIHQNPIMGIDQKVLSERIPNFQAIPLATIPRVEHLATFPPKDKQFQHFNKDSANTLPEHDINIITSFLENDTPLILQQKDPIPNPLSQCQLDNQANMQLPVQQDLYYLNAPQIQQIQTRQQYGQYIQPSPLGLINEENQRKPPQMNSNENSRKTQQQVGIFENTIKSQQISGTDCQPSFGSGVSNNYISGNQRNPNPQGHEPLQTKNNGKNKQCGVIGEEGNPKVKEPKKPEVLEQTEEKKKGRLKFFDTSNNFGFFNLDEDQSDVFVHLDDLQVTSVPIEMLKHSSLMNLRFKFHFIKYIGRHKKSRKAVDIEYLPEESDETLNPPLTNTPNSSNLNSTNISATNSSKRTGDASRNRENTSFSSLSPDKEAKFHNQRTDTSTNLHQDRCNVPIYTGNYAKNPQYIDLEPSAHSNTTPNQQKNNNSNINTMNKQNSNFSNGHQKNYGQNHYAQSFASTQEHADPYMENEQFPYANHLNDQSYYPGGQDNSNYNSRSLHQSQSSDEQRNYFQDFPHQKQNIYPESNHYESYQNDQPSIQNNFSQPQKTYQQIQHTFQQNPNHFHQPNHNQQNTYQQNSNYNQNNAFVQNQRNGFPKNQVQYQLNPNSYQQNSNVYYGNRDQYQQNSNQYPYQPNYKINNNYQSHQNHQNSNVSYHVDHTQRYDNSNRNLVSQTHYPQNYQEHNQPNQYTGQESNSDRYSQQQQQILFQQQQQQGVKQNNYQRRATNNQIQKSGAFHPNMQNRQGQNEKQQQNCYVEQNNNN